MPKKITKDKTSHGKITDLIETARSKHNHICISTISLGLGRIIGIHFDISDAYWIVAYPKNSPKENIVYETMVGDCISIKDHIDKHDLISQFFELQGSPPTKEFIISADTREEFERAARNSVEGELTEEYVSNILKGYDECIAPIITENKKNS